MASHLYEMVKGEFNAQSEQTRLAASELAHVHVDKGEYGPAAALCRSIIFQSEAASDNVGPQWHDSHAVHAMEDLAQIHSTIGEIRSGIIWLEIAAHDALQLWGNSVASIHIFDKLDPSLRHCNRDEDADSYEQDLEKAPRQEEN